MFFFCEDETGGEGTVHCRFGYRPPIPTNLDTGRYWPGDIDTTPRNRLSSQQLQELGQSLGVGRDRDGDDPGQFSG
jgi:hypothetical protein